jgi:carbamoyl-phosphate synthase large subunit
MGVHTGDSITVAPILTLTDKEYQRMRDASHRSCARSASRPAARMCSSPSTPTPSPAPTAPSEMVVVVEMNPRVSRSSALASKATGFPIAKIAAKLAVGYTLDELRNDITGTTSACFEPSIDYVVTKMPRWTFEKFPEADETLTTQMKSVGEAMAIGRTFKEALQKVDPLDGGEALRLRPGQERQVARRQASAANPLTGRPRGPPRPLDCRRRPIEWPIPDDKLTRKLTVPSQGRMYYVRYALKMGWTHRPRQRAHPHRPVVPRPASPSSCEFEDVLCAYTRLEDLPATSSSRPSARLLRSAARQCLPRRHHAEADPQGSLAPQALGIEPVYKLVDTCAAEFEAVTPYYYSTYERPRAVGRGKAATAPPPPSPRPDELWASRPPTRSASRRASKIVILGGGPNRIGQGIEFDYCCCQAALTACDESSASSR